MRKRTINCICDKGFWLLLSILPLILLLMSYLKIGDNGNINFVDIFNNLGFSAVANEYNSLYSISFTEPALSSLDSILLNLTTYLLPNGNNLFIVQFLAYFIRVQFIHIAVDFVLLLPRICTQLINKLTGGDYDD